MATSGVTSFNLTRNDIIKAALRLVTAESGETPSASEIEDASQALNLMIKSWIVPGAHLWTQTEATLFCTGGSYQYSFPGAFATKQYTTLALAANAALGATSLTVDSITGVLNGDFIGIVLDDNTIHWTTVNGVPAGVTITITTGLASAAASGNRIYAFTTKTERPLRIYSLRRQDFAGSETPFAYDGEPMSRREFLALPNKSATGIPVQGWYDPQLTTGKLSLWPTPEDSLSRVTFTYERTLEDFVNIADNPDFPQEWLSALKWNLAVELAPEYKIKLDKFVIDKAFELKTDVLSWDIDQGSLYVSPECQ